MKERVSSGLQSCGTGIKELPLPSALTLYLYMLPRLVSILSTTRITRTKCTHYPLTFWRVTRLPSRPSSLGDPFSFFHF